MAIALKLDKLPKTVIFYLRWTINVIMGVELNDVVAMRVGLYNFA